VTEYEASEARRELEIASEAALVVHVGNIRPHKGHSTLIRAAASIKAARPDVVMVSIGAEKNPGDLERVRREAAELGVAETIRFLGRRPDALRFVAAADVFLNPSDVEGLPLAVLEAMALGTPVVATSVGGVPSVVKDNETGLLVAPSEPESLARATLRLLADSEVAEKLAGAAREVVERAYSLEAMVLAQEAVYRAVLDD
jgi:glycosyltransferase involved in cell wall biosynthesis